MAGTCFLLGGTDGIGVCGCWATRGVGKAGFGLSAGTDGGVAGTEADAASGDGAPDRPTCSFARRFARI